MQFGRGKRAAALAFAVVTGTLGATPAVAAPPVPGTPTAPGTARTSPDPAAGPETAVWPRPQSLRAAGAPVPVTDEVALVADGAADRYALAALRDLLREAGARRISEVVAGAPLPAGVLVVRAGQERPRGAGEARHALPSGGYRLGVDGDPAGSGGGGRITLTGAGPDGLFHAVQTLRQLVREDGTVAAVEVRDWPGTAVRGVTEGFYGTPWTHAQRLAQLDFLGRTKQNRYLYAPGDDPYRQAHWREPYPAQRRMEFRELAGRAAARHVTLGWAVAPGQALCFSSKDDVRALTRKLDAMWALGFRAFQVQFQDVSYSEWHCDADAARFGSGPHAAARAQARVANAVARHLADRHPGSAPLSLLPTEFYEDGATPYRTALADALAAGVEVAWTGVGVVPRTITGRELAGARAAFGGGHPLVTMDNYPVNDYAPRRVFLGPYQGREPAVATGSAALLANAMEQPVASRIPLFTAADYAWNPRAYRPHESWRAAVDDLAAGDGGREEALAALAGNDASSVLGADESAYLRPLMAAYWHARVRAADRGDFPEEDALRDAFAVLRDLPDRLSGTALGREVAPWAGQLARYGEAGTTALDMLRAQRSGDAGGAWTAFRELGSLRKRLGEARVTVGEGVLDPFLARAQKAYRAWTGIDRGRPEPGRAAPGSTTASGPAVVRFPRARPLTAVTVLAEPGTEGEVEIHVPGEGWRRVGRLDGAGATEASARVRADAVRVTGAGRDGVRHLVPWFGDSPGASLDLARERADVEIGGVERLTARLGSLRPSDVSGRLTVEAPRGVRVRLPEGPLTLPRGTAVDVPVEVDVAAGAPAGAYEVRIGFGGVTRTLTVRAFPPTRGPDLARGAAARSSADETPGFPASAAVDGDPGTRWSSPAEDGAWWQVELPRPVRLGRVALHWQDAYAAAYRVQVSPDGRRWRTAATVRDGGGGRESLRMDERDVRYVRVQGERRATRYGYSLWSVEAYAVAEPPPRDGH